MDFIKDEIKKGRQAYIIYPLIEESAKMDFENVDQVLDTGGFILFDDSADNSSWEVTRVIDEIKKTGRYEVIIHNPNYLLKKIK